MLSLCSEETVDLTEFDFICLGKPCLPIVQLDSIHAFFATLFSTSVRSSITGSPLLAPVIPYLTGSLSYKIL
jgi:hypothetical protein